MLGQQCGHLQLVATDFFTTEVWSSFGLVTYYILFFIHLGTRKVHIAGITPNPHQEWIAQVVRNITDVEEGMLMHNSCKYLIHDRDSKFCVSVRRKPRLKLP